MKAKDLLVEFYDPEDDDLNKAEISDVRRPRMTLRHIRKLRNLRDVEREDKKNHLEIIATVYGDSEENSGSGDVF